MWLFRTLTSISAAALNCGSKFLKWRTLQFLAAFSIEHSHGCYKNNPQDVWIISIWHYIRLTDFSMILVTQIHGEIVLA
jgi:hypothetical protein